MPTPPPDPSPLVALTPPTPGSDPTQTIPASPVAGEPTVGEIADRIAAAWTTVGSYRSTFSTFETLQGGSPVAQPIASPRASPIAEVAGRTIVDEVIMPDSRHWTESFDGQVRSEIVVANGLVFLRGEIATLGTPVPDQFAWVTVVPETLPANSPYRELVDQITKFTSPPYTGLSQDERERIAHPSGSVSVNGRECSVYKVTDTTATGERIDVTLAFDNLDLPCSIETRAGGVVGTTVFEFNIPLTIEPPV